VLIVKQLPFLVLNKFIMKSNHAIVLSSLVILSPQVGNAKQNKKKSEKPNIIVIYSDDQRQDALGSSGNGVILTPYLDKIASEGVRFTNANCVFALSSPSRAALLTGRYGSANGVEQLDSDLNPNEKTIAQYLHDDGYFTGISGKWHIEREPQDAGFDFSCWFKGNGKYYGRTIYDQNKTVNPEMHCDQYCVNRSIDFLNEAVKTGKPFFLFHNTQLPHMNDKLMWEALESTKQKYNFKLMPVTSTRNDSLKNKPEYLWQVRNRIQSKEYGYPDSVAIQKHTLDYYSVITEMDSFLEKLFKTIDNLGLRKNTYIFFMSDNGWFLGEHGFTSKVLPYRPATRVPLFVIGPGLKPLVNNDLVLNIDIAPTILDIVELKKTTEIHGKSFWPALNNKIHHSRKSFIYEGLGTYGGTMPNLTVVSKYFRYIETYSDENLNEVIFRELYDERMDPDEMKNLINEPRMQKIVKQLKKNISEHKRNILKK